MLRYAVTLLAAISLLAQSVAATYAFTGCVSAIGLPLGAVSVGFVDRATCLTTSCFGYRFAYIQEDSGACWCHNSQPAALTQVPANGIGLQGCVPGTGSYATFDRPTSFNFDGCYSAGSSDTSIIYGDGVGPAACFLLCASYIYTVYTTDNLNTQYHCGCTNGPINNVVAANCDSRNAYFLFAHSQDAAASSLSRRRKELALDESYCPAGQDACQISPDPAMGYECLATSTEIESCGGCRFGTYRNTSTSIGIDCTSIPGVSSKSVTCEGGFCVTKRCRKGVHLSPSGECI